MKRLLRALIVGTVALLLATPALAQNIPPMPEAYYGSLRVTVNGTARDAPVGTDVSAQIAGREVGWIQKWNQEKQQAERVTTTATGLYGGPTLDDPALVVQGVEGDVGKTVDFYLKLPGTSNQVKAAQTLPFTPGGLRTVLNLGASYNDTKAPRASPSVKGTAQKGETLSFDGSASTDDFGIEGYAWTFGDGASAAGARVTHAYSADGTYTASLTVTDLAGQKASASGAIQVGAPPVVVGGGGGDGGGGGGGGGGGAPPPPTTTPSLLKADLPTGTEISGQAVTSDTKGHALDFNGTAISLRKEGTDLRMVVPVLLPVGETLASFRDAVSGVVYDKDVLTIPVKDLNGRHVLTLRARTETAQGKGFSAEARVLSLEMETTEAAADFTTSDSKIGKVGSSVLAELKGLPSGASVQVNTAREVEAEVKSAMEQAVSAQGGKINSIAFAMVVTKSGLGDQVGKAEVTMKAGLAWVQEQGSANVRILRRGDSGEVEVLATTPAGESGGQASFKGASPGGLSVFALAGVQPLAPTPSPSPSPSPTPTPTASPSPSPTPSPSPSPTSSPTPTPSPSPTVTPSPTPTVTPSPTPSPAPSPSPSPTSSPTPTPSPSPTVTPSPTATPTPGTPLPAPPGGPGWPLIAGIALGALALIGVLYYALRRLFVR